MRQSKLELEQFKDQFGHYCQEGDIYLGYFGLLEGSQNRSKEEIDPASAHYLVKPRICIKMVSLGMLKLINSETDLHWGRTLSFARFTNIDSLDQLEEAGVMATNEQLILIDPLNDQVDTTHDLLDGPVKNHLVVSSHFDLFCPGGQLVSRIPDVAEEQFHANCNNFLITQPNLAVVAELTIGQGEICLVNMAFFAGNDFKIPKA